MPIYIPPLVRKVEIGKVPVNIEDISNVYVTHATSGDALVYNGAGLWINEQIVTEVEFNNYQTSVVGTTGALQSEIINLQNTDANLQQEINQIWVAVKLVFCEDFIGDGASTSCQITGGITNGTFISGGWEAINVCNALPVDITDLNGSPIYTSNNIFTRQRIAVTTVGLDGTINFNYPPQVNQAYKVWYFYSLTPYDRIQNYYREEHVASMEEEYSISSVLASQVLVNTASFNGILNHSDTTVQAALDTIDDHTHDITTLTTTENNTTKILVPDGSGGVVWVNPKVDITISGGTGISVALSGSNYLISVKDYIGKTEVASISGNLQSQIDTLITDTITITSSGGSILVNKTGVNYNLEVATAPIQNHNNLLGLQGGISGQYYHLTSSQFNDFIGKTEVAATSGDLNSRLVIVENTYATKATPISGTYNNVVVNSQGIVTSGGNIVYTVPSDLNPYTLLSTTASLTGSLNTSINNETAARISADSLLTPLTTTAAISSNLQNQIDTLVLDTVSVSSTAGNILVNLNGFNYDIQVKDYISKTEVTSISGSLNTAITSEASIRAAADTLLTPLTTTASISSNLQSQINAVIQESTSISSTGGSIVVSKNGYNYNIEVATAPIQNHNSLNGLQGGISGQYYHLTASQFNDYIGKTEVASTSGSLTTLITNETNARISADSLLTPLTTTASISGGLNSRLTTVENNYATKATPISGTYNNVIVNSQGIVTSGGNIIYTKPSDLNVYTLLTTTQSISATLNTSITNETNARISADVLLTPLTTTASISSGLNSRLTTVESNYATKATPISGTYNNVVVNSQGIVTSGGNLNYAQLASANSLSSTSGSIIIHDASGKLIDSNILITSIALASSGSAGTFNNVIVNSQGIVTSGGNITYVVPSTLNSYTLLTTTSAISANLQSQITALVPESTTITSTGGSVIVTKNNYTYNLEVAKVGLQGRIVCTTETEYTINHATINPITDFPVVSLEVANNNSDLFIQGIYNRTATSFQVVLSGTPNSSNAILYHLSPTASIDLSQYVLKSDLNTIYSISGSSVLINTQHNIIQTNTPIVTTLWSTPLNGDFINIVNDTTSGENVISGNGQLIEGDYSFIIYYGESFTFRYNGTAWKAF